MPEAMVGRRVVVTRSYEQATDLAVRLVALGATPIISPAIRFEPLCTETLDRALHCLQAYDWLVFTSANAVHFFCQRADALNLSVSGQRIAASGSATAEQLLARGHKIDFVPEEFVGEKLAMGLGLQSGMRVLLPRARLGRPEIVELMRDRGAIVDDIPLYDTKAADLDPVIQAELAEGFDAVTFTSPSSVRNFLGIIADLPVVRGHLETAVIACIGPVTAAEAKKCGLSVSVSPSEYTIDGLCRALAKFYSEQPQSSE